MNALRIAMVQSNAGIDPARNLTDIEALLDGVPPVDLIALPEALLLRGDTDDYRRLAEPLTGPAAQQLGRMAARRGSWLLAGSLFEREGNRVYNTCVLFDRAGRIAATYRKMHLFEATLDTGERIREQDAYERGDKPALVSIEGWSAGLSVCYDIRFPELYRWYSSRGAHVLFAPSNFTQRTGRDHWSTLVRARAIENQCFVVAPDQCGANPVTGVTSHGHSMVVGPWGEVLAQGGDEPAVLQCRLDPQEIVRTRARIPALAHRIPGL